MAALVEARGLTKRFGGFTAVDDVTLAVEAGDVLGFLGPNGAGKTTTMKMLTGYLRPSSGQALIAGEDITGGNERLRARLGYLPEGAPLYPEMTPRGFLSFIAHAHGLGDAAAKSVVESAAGAVHLDGVMEQRIETLSKGYRRRVGLAGAILHAPDVLILDEPTDGLDPNQKHEIRSLIRVMAQDRAIIISTHILEEVEALCTRASIITGGRLVADSTPSALKADSKYRGAVTIKLAPDQLAVAAAKLESLALVRGVEPGGPGLEDRLTALAANAADTAGDAQDAGGGGDLPMAVRQALEQEGMQPLELTVEAGRLDDVFRRLTTSADRPPQPAKQPPGERAA